RNIFGFGRFSLRKMNENGIRWSDLKCGLILWQFHLKFHDGSSIGRGMEGGENGSWFTYLLSISHFHSRAVSALRFFFALPRKETKKSRLTNIHLNLSFIA